MGVVIRFPHINTDRTAALRWVSAWHPRFPLMSESDPVSRCIFNGWMFVLSADGLVYFANGIDPGISQFEVRTFIAWRDGVRA